MPAAERSSGWSMADHLEASLVIDALEMALHRRRPAAGLMVHSDRGVQYYPVKTIKACWRESVGLFDGRRGNCYDNAITSFHGAALKTEWVYHERYATRSPRSRSLSTSRCFLQSPAEAFRSPGLSEPRNVRGRPQLIASPRPPFVGKVTAKPCTMPSP